jgi:hypothetical protein
MTWKDYVYGQLVKKCGTDYIGEVCQRVATGYPFLWHEYRVNVVWLTGPDIGHKLEERIEYLDIISLEEEAMYCLAQLGGG